MLSTQAARCAGLTLLLAWACTDAAAENAVPRPPALSDATSARSEEMTSQSQRAAVRKPSVLLVPLGGFPEELTQAVSLGLQTQMGFAVRVADTVPLPAHAYYKPRKRYRAEILAQYLLDHYKPPRGERVLGLTEVDISTTKGSYKDWGVIGLAFIDQPAGLLSSFRLSKKGASAELVQRRAVSTSIHELGHMLGLEHCEEDGCVMLDAEGTLKHVDASDGSFGPLCARKLRSVLPGLALTQK